MKNFNIKKGTILTLQKILKLRLINLGLLKFSRITYVKKKGHYDDFIQKVYHYTFTQKKFLTQPSIKDLKKTIETLNQEGVCILPKILSEEELNDLIEFTKKNEAYATNLNEKYLIDISDPPKNFFRYFWKSNDIIKNKTIKKIVSDSSLHLIAQEYLKCTPILTDITLWSSPIFEKITPDHIFHCDNDGPKFLKFFIYLTDSDENSGVHVFIKKTHLFKNRKMFKVGKRYSDEKLINHYGKENIITLSAKAGTIIAEDTSGFHRGTAPKLKPRLMLQFRYCIMDTFQRPKDEKIKKVKLNLKEKHIKEIISLFYE